jgi:hypothetical protein
MRTSAVPPSCLVGGCRSAKVPRDEQSTLRHGERVPEPAVGLTPRYLRCRLQDVETDVLVALVAGGFALVTAVIAGAVSLFAAARSNSAQHELEQWRADMSREDKREQARLGAKAILDQYREPLLAAAADLGDRISNIRTRQFFAVYLRGAEGHRRRVALLSTLYRFAEYLAWTEVIRRRTRYLHFETQEDTREVAALLAEVSGALKTDSLDGGSSGPARLMLWREEQRAIGGLMQASGDDARVLGFEEFMELYDKRFASWFVSFSRDLEANDVALSERLERLQMALQELVMFLDAERLYVGRSGWLTATSRSGRTWCVGVQPVLDRPACDL